MTLEIFWYCIVILSMICYMILDGFDLGVGGLHLLVKKDVERRVFLNAIGPVWDGNEVWLVIIVGALFAGFPSVYATLVSGFYMFVMVFLTALIFRAVAIEFRSKHASPLWRKTWDTVFCFASIVIAFGVGVILGNLIQGIPLDEHKEFVGTFSGFFTPYSLILGATTVSLLMMHGAIYLVMKTENELHEKLRKWANINIAIFICFYILATIATLIFMPHMLDRMKDLPYLFIVPLLAFLAIFNVPRLMYQKKDVQAFFFSCLCIALLLSVFAIGTFPFLVRSTINPEIHSLTIFNSSSSPLTLKILAIIVAIGIPLVIAYGAYVYHTFRGKVKIDHTSY